MLTRNHNRTPEILSLFLLVSDRPAEKSSLQDLEDINPEPPPATLTWSEILADDPLDDTDDLWKNIDYTVGDSSDDDYIEPKVRSSGPASQESTSDSSADEGDQSIEVEPFTVPNENVKFEEILKAQFWKGSELQGHPTAKCLVTEAQVFRDVLFMLHGLPTCTFVQIDNGSYIFSRQYSVAHMSEHSLIHLLSEFAALGSQLHILRAWTSRYEKIPLLQSCQAAFASRLRRFDKILADLEATAISDGVQAMTSLLDLSETIKHASRHVQQLAEIIEHIFPAKQNQGPFLLVEMLYEKTCANQLCGDEGYKYMAELFLECFRTYLKSVQHWMQNGDLAKSHGILFIGEQSHAVSLTSLWAEQYELLRTRAGDLYAPKFLHLAAKKVFDAGKSVNFLKALGCQLGDDPAIGQNDGALPIEVVDFGATSASLTAFSEIFELAFDQWISQHYRSASSILRHQLESKCRLQDNLDALEYLFLQRDGARSHNFLHAVFARIDRRRGFWDDDSVLTEVLREALAPNLGSAAQRLTVRVVSGRQKTYNRTRSVRMFEDLHVSISLPWALSNVIPQESLLKYQRVYIILVQLQRARHTLVQLRVETKGLPTAHSSHGELYLAQSLRHRLLWFINCTLTYLTELAIDTSTKRIREDLAEAEGMDEMIAIHYKYMLRLEEQCLLSKKLSPIHQALVSVLDLAISFADAHAVYTRQAPTKMIPQSSSSSSDESDEENIRHEMQHDDSSPGTTYLFRLKKMHATFSHLHSFMLAGLQGVHRAGADPKLEALADLLSVDLKKQTRSQYHDG